MSKTISNVDIPLNATVRCRDGECGTCVAVVLDPVRQELTHFVLETERPHRNQYLIPVSDILESDHHEIRLPCRRDDLARYRIFKHIEYLPVEPVEMPFIPDLFEDSAFLWPYVQAAGSTVVQTDVESVPPHELAIHRGARVEATDGDIGRVDEFIVNPDNGQITNLVLREGHFWGQKEKTIPLSAIDHVYDDSVYLKLSKEEIAGLPTVPTRSW